MSAASYTIFYTLSACGVYFKLDFVDQAFISSRCLFGVRRLLHNGIFISF